MAAHTFPCGPGDGRPAGTASAGKAVYLFFYAASASLLPVLTLYYESVGLAGGQVGILAALWPAGSVVGAATWAAIADSTGRHRRVLVATILSSIAAAQLFRLGAGFWSLLPVALGLAFASSPIMPLVDNSVLESLGEDRPRYGRVRLWGAVGWGLSAPLVGLAIDRVDLGIVFPVYGVLMALTLAATIRLPVTTMGSGVDVRAGLRLMASDRRWLLFLTIVLTNGAGGAFTHHYLFIYMNAIGSSGLLRGLALAASTVSELVVFALAHRFLRRYGSRRLLIAALAVTSVRLFLNSVITVPELVLLPQLLHGITFSLFLVAGVTYAQEIAPEGMGATAQSIFTSTNMGIGGIVGALLGGYLYELFGIQQMFLAAALMTGAATLIFLPVFRNRR